MLIFYMNLYLSPCIHHKYYHHPSIPFPSLFTYIIVNDGGGEFLTV